jgi:hypothetical protein
MAFTRLASLRRLPCAGLPGIVFALALLGAGCGNKCDELVDALADCVIGEIGADETDETEEDPAGDPECSGDDEACSTCVLESRLDLCVDYGEALAGCRESGDCK